MPAARHPSPRPQEAEEAEARRAEVAAAREAAAVAAERERLLREAAHLRGHLPKGVVQSLEELRLVEGASGGASGGSPGGGARPGGSGAHTAGQRW